MLARHLEGIEPSAENWKCSPTLGESRRRRPSRPADGRHDLPRATGPRMMRPPTCLGWGVVKHVARRARLLTNALIDAERRGRSRSCGNSSPHWRLSCSWHDAGRAQTCLEYATSGAGGSWPLVQILRQATPARNADNRANYTVTFDAQGLCQRRFDCTAASASGRRHQG